MEVIKRYEDGYLVMLQPGEVWVDLPEVKGHVRDLPWEDFVPCYRGAIVTNNEFVISFIVPESILYEVVKK